MSYRIEPVEKIHYTRSYTDSQKNKEPGKQNEQNEFKKILQKKLNQKEKDEGERDI